MRCLGGQRGALRGGTAGVPPPRLRGLATTAREEHHITTLPRACLTLRPWQGWWRLYRMLLARAPDAGGLDGWVEYLAGQLRALEDALMDSCEFQGS